jgi:hypothetical protein
MYYKNTTITSSVDATIRTLDLLAYPYELEVIGYVEGKGYNDNTAEGPRVYPIRRLTYQTTVLRELMLVYLDADHDDMLVSREYTLENEPKDSLLKVVIGKAND